MFLYIAFTPLWGLLLFLGMKREGQLQFSRQFARLLLYLIGVRLTIKNPQAFQFTGRDNYLIVANHISYLDVIIMHALIPAVFVTSREVEQTPVLGWICKAAGCLFVERRKRMEVQRDIAQMTAVLGEKLNVVFFPEGSTSNGEAFLPFKRPLLEAAVRSRARVLPVCVNYVSVNGEPVSDNTRDYVAWYGDMTFFPHLVKLLSLRHLHAEIAILEPLPFRQHQCRKQLAENAYRALHAHFKPF